MSGIKNKLASKIILTIIFSFLGFSNSFAQANSEEDVKRMFMYHFIKYIDWPDDEKDTDFKIAILNDDKMYSLLMQTLENAKRKGRKIIISKIDEKTNLNDYHVVYVPKGESKHFDDLKEKSSDLNLLFITDKNGIIEKGSCINFKNQGNKLRFEMNLKELEERGLKVAGRLKQVAILI